MDSSRLRDILFVSGLLLTAAGLYFIYWPLAMLVPGVALMGLAVWSSR